MFSSLSTNGSIGSKRNHTFAFNKIMYKNITQKKIKIKKQRFIKHECSTDTAGSS